MMSEFMTANNKHIVTTKGIKIIMTDYFLLQQVTRRPWLLLYLSLFIVNVVGIKGSAKLLLESSYAPKLPPVNT